MVLVLSPSALGVTFYPSMNVCISFTIVYLLVSSSCCKRTLWPELSWWPLQRSNILHNKAERCHELAVHLLVSSSATQNTVSFDLIRQCFFPKPFSLELSHLGKLLPGDGKLWGSSLQVTVWLYECLPFLMVFVYIEIIFVGLNKHMRINILFVLFGFGFEKICML